MDFVDEEEEPDPQLNRITNAVIGAAIAVHREFGPGHEEIVYHRALELEFTAQGIAFARQFPIQLLYRGRVVGYGRLDFLVEDAVIVEIKSVETLSRLHMAQVMSYLRITKLKLGLLINLNVPRLVDGVRRIAN